MPDPTTPTPEVTTEPSSKGVQTALKTVVTPSGVPGELDEYDHAALEQRFGIRRNREAREAAAKEPEKIVDEESVSDDDDSEEAEHAPSTEVKKAEAPTTMKIKVDGKEVQVNINEAFPEFAEAWGTLSDKQKNRIVAMHQKDLSASRRFSEASLTKKQLGNLVALLKENPMQVLAHPSLNHNVREMVESWLGDQLEYEQMDPKDRELVDAKRQIKENEDLVRNAKAETERKEVEALQGRYTKTYQKEIIEAIEGSGLPKSTETASRIAYYLREALRPRTVNGQKVDGVRLKAEDVMDLVRDDYQRMMKRLVGQADMDTLVGLFGDEFTEKARKHLLKPVKQTGTTPEKQADTRGEPKRKKKIDKDEWKRRNAERTR